MVELNEARSLHQRQLTATQPLLGFHIHNQPQWPPCRPRCGQRHPSSSGVHSSAGPFPMCTSRALASLSSAPRAAGPYPPPPDWLPSDEALPQFLPRRAYRYRLRRHGPAWPLHRQPARCDHPLRGNFDPRLTSHVLQRDKDAPSLCRTVRRWRSAISRSLAIWAALCSL